jgi:uncharacterized protein YjbI with pentapeptide repeats
MEDKQTGDAASPQTIRLEGQLPVWLQTSLQIISGIIVPFLVGIAIVIGAYQVANYQTTTSKAQNDTNQKIATEQGEEATLQVYLDDMGNLLLSNSLASAKPTDEVTTIADAKTFVTLSRLNNSSLNDPQRKADVVLFLYKANLIGNNQNRVALINLEAADLHDVALSGSQLAPNDLSYIDLHKAILVDADFRDTVLSNAILYDTDLSGAHLSHAILENVDFSGANLNGTDLSGADLKGAIVTPTQLNSAKSLQGAIMPDGTTHP